MATPGELLQARLPEVRGRIELDRPLADLTWFRVGGPADVLVNLGQDVPSWFSRYARVAELVSGDEAARQAGRDRFRFYRDRGIEPETHQLGAG